MSLAPPTAATPRGGTLAEVLVACTILGLLGIVLLEIFLHISSAAGFGASRLAIQQRVRETMRRVAPLLRQAIRPNFGVEAIYLPPIHVTASNVVFAVPENLLTPPSLPFDPRKPDPHLYQMRFSGTQLVLQDIYNPASTRVLGDQLVKVSFTRSQTSCVNVLVQVQAQIRGASGKARTEDYNLQTSIQLVD